MEQGGIMSEGLFIKVIFPNKVVKEVFIREGSIVEDVLVAAGVDCGCNFLFNGKEGATIDTPIVKGDSIEVLPEIMVTMAQFGTGIKMICVKTGSTLGDVIRISGHDEGYDITLNDNEDIDLDTEVKDGDIVTVNPRIQGGR
jgi:sulfur carrier protein ThiS